MDAVKIHLNKLHDINGDFEFETDSADRIKIVRNGHTVTIRCWSDSLLYTRGFGSDGLVIIDEAVQMSKRFFLENVKPVMAMANTSFAIISSPGDQDNWVTRAMLAKTSDGELAFDVLNQVFICDNCMKLPHAKRVDCTHIRAPPFWLSSEKQEVNRNLAVALGGVEAYLTEERGLVKSVCAQPAFDVDECEHVFRIPFAPYLRMQGRPKCLFIAMDPSGDGPSKTAVITAYYDAPNLVVCTTCLYRLRCWCNCCYC